MTETAARGLEPLDSSGRLTDDYVHQYYLPDSKLRVAVARVRGALYAFEELCTHEASGSRWACSAARR